MSPPAIRLVVLGAALAMTRAAIAQPGPPQPAPDPAPPPEPATLPAPAAEPPAPAVAVEPAPASRPGGLAFGIGVGYLFPISLQTPNVTSVRLRLPGGLTFEPRIVFATTSDEVDSGISVTNKQTELTLGALTRYPLRVHRKVDLEAIGNASVSNRRIDPGGAANDRAITALALSYGVALAYWFTPHWNLSLTATNPLLSYTRTRQEMGTTTIVDRTTTIGLVFDPQVALMVHLYE